MRGLHERAVAWYEASGDLGNAVYWAVRAGNRHHVVKLMARGGFAHAFVNRQDLSGLGLRDLLPLRRPVGGDALRAAEFAIVSSAIEAVFADADAAARELAHLPSPKSDEILADPDLLVTSDLVELILGQKASDVGAVDAAAYRLLGRCSGTQYPRCRDCVRPCCSAQASTAPAGTACTRMSALSWTRRWRRRSGTACPASNSRCSA